MTPLMGALLACGSPTDRLGTEAGDPVSVLIAAKELAAGQPIDAEDLHVQLVRPNDVPSDTISAPADAIGRIPRHRILPQEPLRSTALVAPDAIGPGMRAVTVPTGDLQPTKGGSVDVWWTPPGDPVPCLALTDLAVRAVDGDRALLVAPVADAVQLLALARQPTFRLSARRSDDDGDDGEAACSR